MTSEKMNDLTVAVKETKKITEKKKTEEKKKSKSTMTMKFCFNYNLLKTWLAWLTVWWTELYRNNGENTLLDAGISTLIQHLN